MASETSEFQIGSVGFGTIGNYPPTRWRFAGLRAGSCVLEHVKHPSHTGPAYPDQFVSWEDVRRVMANRRD